MHTIGKPSLASSRESQGAIDPVSRPTLPGDLEAQIDTFVVD
jgi:hypothetical protein